MKTLANLSVGFGICGSFCTFSKVIPEIKKLVDLGVTVHPIMSFNAYTTDTRFYKIEEFIKEIETLTGNQVIHTIKEAEPIGPKGFIDLMVVAPCTGNTLAKMANGITDTPVLMAAKATLRNSKPVIIGVATNDGLGLNLKNIGILLNSKNIFFVPFGQDHYKRKPNSLVAKMDLIYQTLLFTLEGKQIQPVIEMYTID